ncbi:MAG: ECF-type sigma factor [Acidobacteriota bacterium]
MGDDQQQGWITVPPGVLAGGALDKAELDALFAQIYGQLRRLARRQRRRGPGPQTLDTTSLVHEVYARFLRAERISVTDRAHFLALAARAMRQILINRAESRGRRKRGGGAEATTLLEHHRIGAAPLDVLLDINTALDRLAERSERMATVVECRFFGGLSTEETAAALGVGARTVEREWSRAKIYLAALLDDQPSDSSAAGPGQESG